jgi:hypothetical protein
LEVVVVVVVVVIIVVVVVVVVGVEGGMVITPWEPLFALFVDDVPLSTARGYLVDYFGQVYVGRWLNG